MGESGSNNSADSYIGSVISLTSKSEIRYEGTLYTVDTENSNIALQNVRSFGTEGRKKEGPQIPASDKVYEYIIFRGTDIKDLQVKSSPPVQAPAQYSDPAIISLQAQYSQSPSITPAYRPAVGISADRNPSMPFTGVPAAPFQNGVPSLYQPASAMGSWGPLPPPGANGTGLAMPVYWTGPAGFYRPQTGPGHLQQQQHPLPHSVLLPPIQQSLLQPLGQPTVPAVSSPVSSTQLRPSQSSSGSAMPAISVASSEPLTFGTTGTNATSVISSAAASSSSSFTTLSEGISVFVTPASKTPRKELGQMHASKYADISLSTVESNLKVSSPKQRSSSGQKQASALYSAFDKASVSNTQNHKEEQKLTDPLRSSTQPLESISPSENQHSANPPLLPLPTAHPRPMNLGNGNVPRPHRIRRARGRGRAGVVRHAKQQFMEDFDFIAMNEKFNKDEVWGELGKVDVKETSLDEEEDCVDDNVEDTGLDSVGAFSKPLHDQARKPVYIKDEFFDSLSCESLEHGDGRPERTKFSEQRKIDTETFGSFPTRSRGGRMRVGTRRGDHRSGYYVGHSSGGKVHSHGRGRGAMRSSNAE